MGPDHPDHHPDHPDHPDIRIIRIIILHRQLFCYLHRQLFCYLHRQLFCFSPGDRLQALKIHQDAAGPEDPPRCSRKVGTPPCSCRRVMKEEEEDNQDAPEEDQPPAGRKTCLRRGGILLKTTFGFLIWYSKKYVSPHCQKGFFEKKFKI